MEFNYSYQELMAIVFSRDMQDGEIGACGGAAAIPMAAMQLAQETHAPNLIIAGDGLCNPKSNKLSFLFELDTNEMEAVESIYEIFELSEGRGISFWFNSGIQTDMYGNINLHAIGDDPYRPKLRGPGVGNISYSATANRGFYNYPTTHTKRNFVEKVDFITVPGNIDGPDGRKRVGLNTLGPLLVVTPLAVMDFDEATGRMRLKSVHDGRMIEDVVKNTGFELIMPEHVPTTPPPTKKELELLRTKIDSTGYLKSNLA